MDEGSRSLLELIKRRRSCRFFDSSKRVTKRDLMAILEAGRWAPSARNLQPLEFIIVKDNQGRDRLSEFSRQKHPSESPVSVVVVGDLKRAKDVGDISPHDTTTHLRGMKTFMFMDAAASIQNMLLMAESLGYNTLWISSFDEEALEDFLGLPDRFMPVAIICIGKTRKEIQVPPKRTLGKRVHQGSWSPRHQDESHIGFSKKINVKF
ncbi:MAG: hypothetical protein GF416_04020 [Candidatus Altiarchaeales archaeon]|nr:hypothetical protein [Candidatus Altiarchaeales archaeon]MBD3416286.1 hypothetical protein [Candidatus Altiarchaeales archaeon]